MKTDTHFFLHRHHPGRLAGTGAALLASLLLWGSGADAAVQISTLGTPIANQIGIRNAETNPADPYDYSIAMSFTTGDTLSTLNHITIASAIATLEGNQDFVFSLYATDVNSRPTGSALVSLSHPDLSVLPTYTNTVFTPTSPFSLQANTTYSIVIEPPATGVNVAGFTITNESDGYTFVNPGWSFGTLDYRIDAGEWQPYNTVRLMADIDVTAVPEPSTWLLLGMSLGGVLLLRRRRSFARVTG